MATGFQITGTISGGAQTKAALKAVQDKLQKKITRKATAEAVKLMLREGRARIDVRTGLSKKTMASKVMVYRNGKAVGLVGSQKGVSYVIDRDQAVKVTKKSSRRAVTLTLKAQKIKSRIRGRTIYKPSSIFHLINKRTRFLDAAFSASQGQAKANFAAVVKQGIEGG